MKHYSTQYLLQLDAAVRRAEEVENWATAGAVMTAAQAVIGDREAQLELSTSPAWELDYRGDLPVGSFA